MTARVRLLVFIGLVLGGFTLKAPAVNARMHLTPDAVYYLNIARNVAAGRGYVSAIKLHHADSNPVIHAARRDCPPLYPLFAAGIIRVGGNVRTLAVVNMLLVCIASGLVFLIGERLFDWRVGLVAGMAAVLAPNLFRAGMTAMSDPLALVLGLSALSVVIQADSRWTRWLVAGVLIGLATLARYPYALVALAVAVHAFRGPRARLNATAYSLGLLPVGAYMVSVTPSVQTLHYCVDSFHAAMWNMGYPVDPLFCIHHPGVVAMDFARNLGFYVLDLVAGQRGLFVLGAGLVLWLWHARRSHTEVQRLVAAVAAVNVLVYASTWSIPPVRGSRFLLLSYCLLLPFCAAGLVIGWKRSGRIGKTAVIGVCAATALFYAWGCVASVSHTSNSDCRPLPPEAIALVARALPPNAVIASNNPWELNYSTGLPTALLPRNLDRQELQRFVERYGIQGIVLLGPCRRFETAGAVATSYRRAESNSGIAVYRTMARTRRTAD